MTTEQWYVLDQSGTSPTPRGPYELEQIRQLVRQSMVNARTQVARVGEQSWQPASADPVLSPLFSDETPLSPPTVPMVPSVAASSPFAGHEAFSGDYTIGAMLSLATEVFKKNYAHLIACALLAGLFSVPGTALDLVARILAEGGRQMEAAIVLWLLALGFWIIVSPAISAGLYWVGVNAVRGGGQVSDVLAGFRRFGGVTGTFLLWMLASVGFGILFYVGMILAVLIGALLAAATNEIVGIVAGIILGVPILVFGLLVLIRVSFASTFSLMLLCDPTVQISGGAEAMRVGWRMVGHAKGRVAYGLLVAGLLWVLSIFLFCIGYLLVGLPFFMAAMGAGYEMMRRNPSFDGYLAGTRA